MKYIKTFEKLYEHGEVPSCWKVTSKRPDFLVALDKIGVPKETISWLDEKSSRAQYTKNDIIILYKKDKDKEFYWTWAELQDKEKMLDFYKTHYNYQGEVKVTPEEIELWNDAKKYNL